MAAVGQTTEALETEDIFQEVADVFGHFSVRPGVGNGGTGNLPEAGAGVLPNEALMCLAKVSFPDLSISERRLVECVALGSIWFHVKNDANGAGIAYSADDERGSVLRAELITWLCKDTEAVKYVTETGIVMIGARIEGTLALHDVSLDRDISFVYCTITDPIECFFSRFKSLSFFGCQVFSIFADGLKVSGNFLLQGGFAASDGVMFRDVEIGGDLNCEDGSFQNGEEDVLWGENLSVGGNVLFRGKFCAKGAVGLPSAVIGGDFDCSGGKFLNNKGEALFADQIRVSGNLLLCKGFHAEGEVGLRNAVIGGDFDCRDSYIQNDDGVSLSADRIKVGGNLFLRVAFNEKESAEAEIVPQAGLMQLAEANFPDMSESERRLIDCVAQGTVWFHSKNEENREVIAYSPGSGRDSVLRAELIVWLCKDAEAARHISETGIVIIGARIEGALSLNCVYFGKDISFVYCTMAEPIGCVGSSFKSLSFFGCQVASIFADGVRVIGNVLFQGGFAASSGVSLRAAEICGDLDCEDGSFENDKGNALWAEDLNVGGSVLFRGKFCAKGSVGLPGAVIGGEFDCRGGKFLNDNGDALSADRIKVGGNLLLCDGFHAEGEVWLRNAAIVGDLDCSDGYFQNNDGVSLSADRIKVDGSVFLSGAFHEKGTVDLRGAVIAKDFDCDGGKFENARSNVLLGEGLKVAGNLTMRNGFIASGTIRLRDADINGNFDCSGAKLQMEKGNALFADCLHVHGNLMMCNGFEAKGTVRLPNAGIGGHFNCEGGVFEKADGEALLADNLKTGGGVFLRGGFRASGGISLRNALVGADFSCANGTFERENGNSISAEGIMVVGGIYLRGTFKAIGCVDLHGAEIEGNLACDGGTFGKLAMQIDSKPVTVLNVNKAKIGGSVIMRGSCTINGTLSLAESHIAKEFQWHGVKDSIRARLDLRETQIYALWIGKGWIPRKENCLFKGMKYTMIAEGMVEDAIWWKEFIEAYRAETKPQPTKLGNSAFSGKISQIFYRK